MKYTDNKLIITKRSTFSRQVCVPADWSDEQATEVLSSIDLCGTEGGWMIRREYKNVANYQTRVKCDADPERVHIVFDA